MLSSGDVIDGKYRIIGPIGEGGMGTVYAGEHIRIRRRVAIKVLHPSVAENREVVARFEREAQAAGCIGNDHILEVLDLGELPNGQRYIVMEFLVGESLGQRLIRRSRLSVPEVVPIFRQILTGLQAAHSVGILHRDLKPDNVFILRHKAGYRDFVKLIDFGICRFQKLDEGTPRMTRAGIMVGTPLYMAPEQASGRSEADVRSDIYSVGVMLYECLCGEVPFTSKTFNELLFQIVLGEVKPLSARADIDPAFDEIVTKAMSRDPNERFQTCAEMIEALDAWRTVHEPRFEPPQVVPAAEHHPVARWATPELVSYTPGGMHTPSPEAGYYTPQHGFDETLHTASPNRSPLRPVTPADEPASSTLLRGPEAGFLPPQPPRPPDSNEPRQASSRTLPSVHPLGIAPRTKWLGALGAALTFALAGAFVGRSMVGTPTAVQGSSTAESHHATPPTAPEHRQTPHPPPSSSAESPGAPSAFSTEAPGAAPSAIPPPFGSGPLAAASTAVPGTSASTVKRTKAPVPPSPSARRSTNPAPSNAISAPDIFGY